MSADQKPFVSIVMPALNEERYIEAAIRSVMPGAEALDCEIMVMDGGSTDRTAAIVTAMSTQDARIKLLANPRRVQSAAMNIAAREADPRARYLLRADCHADYPPGFAERSIAALRETGAASVVVTMHSQGKGCMQRGIAAASNSRLGNGGSAHRRESSSGYVDHGHHAAFDRETYLALGGYDESFRHNEDAEYDQRVIAAGKRIYLLGDLPVRYFPRADLVSLARQYRNYGWGRANTLLKHRARPRLRQMLPVLILLGNAAALALSPLQPLLLAVPVFYLGLCCAWGLALTARAGEGCLALSGPAAMVMHMSWALGFLSRLASAAFGGRTPLASAPGGVQRDAGRPAG